LKNFQKPFIRLWNLSFPGNSRDILQSFFFQVSGISFAFDGSKEPGSRIDPQFIKVGDEYVGPDKVYRMVTKAYLANGKDGYDVLGKCNQVRKLS
jgi:5'-nucleotidase